MKRSSPLKRKTPLKAKSEKRKQNDPNPYSTFKSTSIQKSSTQKSLNDYASEVLKRTPIKRASSKSLVGGYTKELRESIFARDKGRCQLCGAPGEQVHHVITRGRFYAKWYTFDNVHNPINLMLVCHRCHHDIHSKPGVLERAIAIQEKRFGPLRISSIDE